MKRVIALLLVAAMIFVGCKVNKDDKKVENAKEIKEVANDAIDDLKMNSKNEIDNKMSSKKISIVATVFPIYDWVKRITDGNSNVELTMLLDKGTDLHSFQPSADDIVKIVNSDVFIYVGGESDTWVADIIKNNPSDTRKVINLVDELGDAAKIEELKEGMTESKHDHDHDDHDHEEDHDHDDHDDDHDHHDEGEVDEHIWLSLKNAKVLVGKIAEVIKELDLQNKEIYEDNADAYITELDVLDTVYEKETKDIKNKTLIFGDRFPFRYLVEDYGLDYYAAFVGCSADVEASFETIRFLADKVDKLDINTIFIIDKSDGKIAKTIAETAKKDNIKIEVLNSMQTTTAEDVKAGVSYISIMEGNLEKIASL